VALEHKHDLGLDIVHGIPHTAHEAAFEGDYAACRTIMQAASRNYSFAARFLPIDKLPHVEALYAVMRIGDDLVDVHHKGAEAARAIQEFEAEYWHAFETGSTPNPVLRAYLHTAHKFNIRADLLSPYFRAMIEDLTVQRFPTFADLLHYMDGSAIPVGRIMSHILGAKTHHVADVYPSADALSIAMQLSNFWRDIGQDWGIGRVYIPQEDMDRFNYTENDLANHRITPNFIKMIEFEIERTEAYYREARPAVSLLASGQIGVMSALNIYHAILPAIRRNRYDVFSKRAGTSRLQKLTLVAAGWWQTFSQ
jgi:15-cis-phytoene synthase